ncbi:MAG: hypothetical protein IKY83_03375 [Proteobacteria bacterium]|nr:hypothetical protein [Pseudomonadota bacterium]
MTEQQEVQQRQILRAFFRSAEMVDENIRWRRYRFNQKSLKRHLKSVTDGKISDGYIHEITECLGLTVLRVDPLKLRVYGFERGFDRQQIAEGLGSFGVQFFPTRQSASRSAFESAREAAYYGAGAFDAQFFECPIGHILSEIDPTYEAPRRGTILRDMRDGFETDEVIFDVLKRDEYFQASINDEKSFEAFQQQLRQMPCSSDLIDKCSEFFNRRATIGVRDTMRWMLGSRHPWFAWKQAQELIESAFEKHRSANFNTPQIVYYTYDPSITEEEIEDARSNNDQIVQEFSLQFETALASTAPEICAALTSHLTELSRWILDIHHDYPDFDLESQGSLGPETHFEFLGHSIHNKVNQEFLGENYQMRLNRNMRAHFAARGLDKTMLSVLDDAQKETFFSILGDVLSDYDSRLNMGHTYRRLPCKLFLIQDLGNPAPRENERLLDAFDLSQMTQMEHASYMRVFPEISEKLVVFFTLTLRHMLETEHVPDLKPRDFVKDFLLLGLWGTRTPNIHVNLYVDKSLDERDLAETLTRSEIRFIGVEQVETHPLEHIREEAKVLRLAVSHFAPLIEPSILRNLGTFTMALEEFRDKTHVFKLDPISVMHYALDMTREAARWGIRGSVKDVMTVFEYLLDNTYDRVSKHLDVVAQMIKKFQDSTKP